MSIVLSASHSHSFETHWDDFLFSEKLPDPKVVGEVKRLEKLLIQTAQVAWSQAALTPEEGRQAGAVFGSFYATNGMREYIQSTLDQGGKWLNPEAFLYYSPHGCAGSVVQTLGLHGDAITFLGPDSDKKIIDHGIRLLKQGRLQTILAIHFEWATPFASWLAGQADFPLDSHHGLISVCILETKTSALKRQARVLVDLSEFDSKEKSKSISDLQHMCAS